MALFKAVKLEVMILCYPGEENEDIVKVVEEAMIDYCAFVQSLVKVVEEHETVFANLEEEATA